MTTSSHNARLQNTSNAASTRKKLPEIDDDVQLALASKMVNRHTATPVGNHSYGTFFREYTLMAEYNLLKEKCGSTSGAYVMPSNEPDSPFIGVLFVHGGIYAGAVLQFSITIPPNFPDDAPPTLSFHPPVFHPQVNSETGELDIRNQRSFNPWRRNVCHIWQIVAYAKRCFYKITIGHNPPNPEAAHLYESDKKEFSRRVAENIKQCQPELISESTVQTVDVSQGCPFLFTQMDDSTFQKRKQQMLSYGADALDERLESNPSESSLDESNFSTLSSNLSISSAQSSTPSNPANSSASNNPSGYSWLKPGSVQLFASNTSAIT